MVCLWLFDLFLQSAVLERKFNKIRGSDFLRWISLGSVTRTIVKLTVLKVFEIPETKLEVKESN